MYKDKFSDSVWITIIRASYSTYVFYACRDFFIQELLFVMRSKIYLIPMIAKRWLFCNDLETGSRDCAIR